MPKAKVGESARKLTAISEPYTKSQVLTSISESTGLTKRDVSAVLDELSAIINRHLKKRGAGQFTVPGLMKIKTVRKPATKARKGTNPFTGEETMFKAKPARTIVKVQPLKGLKDMVN
ncbi:MAG: HU family DNA-binding protein [Ectothiorhodospiraceae bacterium]|nr:HU family DNA-binding protein [Chromatiales bacterium]MCP5154981.1 HU family DNA-binding protein [Ectothiorhodospiraceae bacterium]